MDERRYSSWLLERLAIGEVNRLRIGTSTVGRHSSSVIRITDSHYVSRNHAKIVVSEDDQMVTVEDLQSVNGIFVNNVLYRSASTSLRAGDQIGFGVLVDEDVNNPGPEYPVFLLRHVPLSHRGACNVPRPCPLSFKEVRTPNAVVARPPVTCTSSTLKDDDSIPSTSKGCGLEQPSTFRSGDSIPSAPKSCGLEQPSTSRSGDSVPNAAKGCGLEQPSTSRSGDSIPNAPKGCGLEQTSTSGSGDSVPSAPKGCGLEQTSSSRSADSIPITPKGCGLEQPSTSRGVESVQPIASESSVPTSVVGTVELIKLKEPTTTAAEANEYIIISDDDDEYNLPPKPPIDKSSSASGLAANGLHSYNISTGGTILKKNKTPSTVTAKETLTGGGSEFIVIIASDVATSITEFRNDNDGTLNEHDLCAEASTSTLQKSVRCKNDAVLTPLISKDESIHESHVTSKEREDNGTNKEKSPSTNLSVQHKPMQHISPKPDISKEEKSPSSTNLPVNRKPSENMSSKPNTSNGDKSPSSTNLSINQKPSEHISSDSDALNKEKSPSSNLSINFKPSEPIFSKTDISNEGQSSSSINLPRNVVQSQHVSSDTKSTNALENTKESESSKSPQKSDVRPSSSEVLGNMKAHMPIISSIKQERVRTISAEIENIFGETDDIIMDQLRNIDPYVYNTLKPVALQEGARKGGLISGDCIELSSDDDLEEIGELISTDSAKKTNQTEVETKKCGTGGSSPSIFDSSLDDSNKEQAKQEKNEKETLKNGDSSKVPDKVDETPIDERRESRDDEELMFSQIVIDDMKAELADEDINAFLTDLEDVDEIQINENESPQEDNQMPLPVKMDMDNTCWSSNDEEDDDFDNELESKVLDWSTKLFSQTNMSQIYDVEESDQGLESRNKDQPSSEEDEALTENNGKYAHLLNNVCIKLKRVHLPTEAEIGSSELNEDDSKDASILDSPAIKPANTKKPKVIYSSDDEDYNKPQDAKKNESAEKLKAKSDNNCIAGKKPENDRKSASKRKNSSDCKEAISSVRRRTSSEDSFSKESAYYHKEEEKISTSASVNAKSKLSRKPPEIIEAPQLPRHRGKLRGVSAQSTNSKEKLNTFIENIRHENIQKDLRKNSMKISSSDRNSDKETSKSIKESRRKLLKELAEKQTVEETRKRKASEEQDREGIVKTGKAKVTNVNRGAFLTEDPGKAVTVRPYKIPRKAIPESTGYKETAPKSLLATCASNKAPLISILKSPKGKDSTNLLEQTLSKCNLLPDAPTCLAPTGRAAARATRTTNKITFASMQRNFVQSHLNQKKLELISNTRSCIPDIVQPKDVNDTKKKVRFNDIPEIHYIERVRDGAERKVDSKDLLPNFTLQTRWRMIRESYPIVDHTSEIISMFLDWSNHWLENRNSEIQAAEELIVPMRNQFESFEDYKKVIFPLMKLEFLSVLEQQKSCRLKPFKVKLQTVTEYQDRFALNVECDSEPPKFDMVILDLNDRRRGIFAYVSFNRKASGTSYHLTLEILAKNYTRTYLSGIKELKVQPAFDNIRIELGAFNAVYQLQSTPLFKKILNPLELIKCKPITTDHIKYKGYDKLNSIQERALKNTYVKIINEAVPNITLIKGPPGTGKSLVVSNLALQALFGSEVRIRDRRILICAQSNVAVDVIAKKLYDVQQRMRSETQFRVIRFGMPDKIHPQLTPITLQYLVKREIRKRLSEHNIKVLNENKENIENELRLLEMQIVDMQKRNIKGTVEEEHLSEKRKQVKILRSILNQTMRPEDERSIYTWHLKNANIVCTTLSSCVKLSQYVNYFDICIIDEATQCVEPWTLLPLKFGISSLVLVGDVQQLPATVLSKKAMELGYGNSMFTRMQRCLENANQSQCLSSCGIIYGLRTQYRMHPEICRWPNKYFYKNELLNGIDPKILETPIAPFSIINLSYSQNNNCVDGKISNNLEAEFVVKLLKALDAYIPNKYNSYGVITPYAEHRKQLASSLKESGLRNIMVNTIDSYQGVEKDVIIISNARTDGIGFLSNHQRLNVAVTRPRKCLILCGNFRNLESVSSWASLLLNARERNVFHEVSAESALDIHRNVIEKIKLK